MNKIKHIFGEIKAIPDNVDETRTIEFVISDETKDRHRTVLKMDNWNLDNFNNNGIVGYQHNVYGDNMCDPPNPDDVIGKATAYTDGDKLIGKVVFEPAEINPLAEKIFQKIKFGSLKATSVGFLETKKGSYGEGIQAKGMEDETYYYGGQELLEFSIVNIPSNPAALKRAMRDQTANALTYIHKQLGGEYPFSTIEKLTVGEIIKMLNKDGLQRDAQENKDNIAIDLQKAELNSVKVEQEQMAIELELLKLSLNLKEDI